MLKNIIIILIASVLSACFSSESETSSQPSNEELDLTLTHALENPKAFQTDIKETCTKFNAMLLEVAETIRMGSRIWNAGGAPITLRLYEGVAYRVLYEVDDECPQLSHAFQGGLNRAAAQESINEKGRMLRETLDLIMGGPPIKPPGA